jgi:hypothetical protein
MFRAKNKHSWNVREEHWTTTAGELCACKGWINRRDLLNEPE